MRPPDTVTGEARKYWLRHAKPLQESGTLTERDRDSFALLCRIWGLLEATDATPGDDNYRQVGQFVKLSQEYQKLAKQFGLLPRDRKSSGMEATLDPFAKLNEALNAKPPAEDHTSE